MSNDIRSILERMALVEGRTVPVSPRGSMTAQQERVPQLPALFKPRDISPTLKKKPYQAHPMDGYMVGENALAEAMQEVEEDMISKVKGQFTDYLETLEKKNKIDQRLIRKAKAELNIDDDPQTEEDATWDADVAPISGPEDAADTETAHGIEDHVAQAMSQPTAPVGETLTDTDRGVEILGKAVGALEDLNNPEDIKKLYQTTQDAGVVAGVGAGMAGILESPVKTYTMEDGTCVECWGNDTQGYELRRGDRKLPTRFPRLGHADMAMRLFQKRREAAQQDANQDYLEER